ncbi:MAG: endonuclease domain-containing protein [Candidatus Dormibacteraceae bacterium]
MSDVVDTNIYNPASWSWTIDTIKLEQFRDSMTLPRTNPDLEMLYWWQAGRCAICGCEPSKPLVRDHDHKSSLIRGLLCRWCNTMEGNYSFRCNTVRDKVRIERYRKYPPAIQLGIQLHYAEMTRYR